MERLPEPVTSHSKAHLTLGTANQAVFPLFTAQNTGASKKLQKLLKFTRLVRGGARVLNQGVCETKYSKEHSKHLEICQVQGT